MKKFNCGDVVWCWERTADDFLINGFKAQCKVDVNKFDDCLQVVTESGDVKSVYIRDTEPYNEFIKYREHESIMNAFKKFKTLSHNKKKEMLQKIGLLILMLNFRKKTQINPTRPESKGLDETRPEGGGIGMDGTVKG